MSDFHVGTTPRARKEHHCDLCGRPIAPGTVHALGRGMFDGYFYAYRHHLACQAVVQAWGRAFDYDWEAAPSPGDARAYLESLAEVLAEREATAARLKAAGNRVCGQGEVSQAAPLRGAALGWEAIVAKLPEGADSADVAHLRQLYTERVGCPVCGRWASDDGCTCAGAAA